MRNWGFILAGVALAWYGIFRGAKGLEIKLKSYRFNSVNLSDYTMQLVLNLSIKNPLLIGVKIKGVIGDVYAQGVKIGTVNSNYDYDLSGGATHVLPVTVNLKMAGVAQAAAANIDSGNIKTLTVAFDGKLYAGEQLHKYVGIPLKFELDYNDMFGA